MTHRPSLPTLTPKELAERESKPIALAWIDAAIPALREHLAWLLGADESSTRAVVTSALATNFSHPSSAGFGRIPLVWFVLGTFVRAREVIAASDRWFLDVSVDEAGALFPASVGLPPAYAIFGHGVFFTPTFSPFDAASRTGFGPRCRAAMVVHESIHVVDRRSGEPEIHVSEWMEPAFSAQTPEQSLHNPSAYASFAAQVYEGALEWPLSVRYGAGRPED